METSTKIDPRFIQNIQGREFVKFEGLLDLSHRNGLTDVQTDLVQIPAEDNGHVAIIRARVQVERGTFTGIGDASKGNVNPKIAPHIIRMAETRAVARALRLACNIGMCSVEELGGDAEPGLVQNGQQRPVNGKQYTGVR